MITFPTNTNGSTSTAAPTTTKNLGAPSIQPMSPDHKGNLKGKPIYLFEGSNHIIGYDTFYAAKNVGEIDRKRAIKHTFEHFTCQAEGANKTTSLPVQQADDEVIGKLKSPPKIEITLKTFRDTEFKPSMEKLKTKDNMLTKLDSECMSKQASKQDSKQTLRKNQIKRKMSKVEYVDLVESSEESDDELGEKALAKLIKDETSMRQAETKQVKGNIKAITCEGNEPTEKKVGGDVDLEVKSTKVNKLSKIKVEYDESKYIPNSRESERKQERLKTEGGDGATRKKLVKSEPLFLDQHGNLDLAEFPPLETVQTIKETIFHFEEEESDFSTVEFSRELECAKFSPNQANLEDRDSPEVIAVVKHEVSDRLVQLTPTFPIDDDEFNSTFFNNKLSSESSSQELRVTPTSKMTGWEKPGRRSSSKLSPKKDIFKSPESTKGTLCNICGDFDTSRKELHSFLYEMKGLNRYKRFLCMTCNNRFAAAELEHHKNECFLTSPDDIGFNPKTKKFRMMACETCAEMRKFM